MMEKDQTNLKNYLPGNEIYGLLESIKTGTNTPLRVMLFIKNYDKTLSEINEDISFSRLKFVNKKELDRFIVWNVESQNTEEDSHVECPHCGKRFKVDEEEKIPYKSYFIEFKEFNLIVLVSNYNKHMWESLISGFDELYPILGRVFYRSADLRYILSKVERFKDVEVIGKTGVAKRLYEDPRTDVTYAADTIEGFYARAKRENSWIDSLEVTITKIGNIRLARKGLILYNKPFNFKPFFEILVSTIIEELLINRRKLFENKSRTQENPQIKPIGILFSQNYFSEKENIQRLMTLLSSKEDYEVGAVYLSDGLAHISIFDYKNGSSFDIFINNENELRIIPQTQVTESALESLVIRITDKFEGNII